MNLFKKIFGIKTKDLYLAKLARTEEVKFYGYSMYTTIYSKLVPNKYVLVRKTKNGKYKNQIDGSKYNLSSNSHCVDEIGVSDLRPIGKYKKRISYNDAIKLLDEKNVLNKEIYTKDLYLGELVMFNYKAGNVLHIVKGNPSKYVLVRKTLSPSEEKYEDIFTKTKYNSSTNKNLCRGEIVVDTLEPIISDAPIITYYDADVLLKSKNSVYLKK